MSGKKANALREYHMLVIRASHGFAWQIRYDRHANPVQSSSLMYPTQAEAVAAGEEALAAVKREAASSVS